VHVATTTLTLEAKFKSTGPMAVHPTSRTRSARRRVDAPDELAPAVVDGTTWLSIGELARRAGIATSAIRYYERRGLLVADERRSGQRRYRVDSLRRLVFIGMLQDAGLSLDDIEGILGAADVDEWKAIARSRLAALDEEIERLANARAYLQGALLCRFDHPATDCRVMGAEIDRRLAERP
jgi:DNA-binding transcriptional MerR regulator